MTYNDDTNELFNEHDEAVARASYDYYRVLLWGSSVKRRRQLQQAWVCTIQRQWPDLVAMDICERCSAIGAPRCMLNDQRRHMIAEAAYYRAQRRGFYGGSPVQDWLEAESEIDQTYFNISGYLRSTLFHSNA